MSTLLTPLLIVLVLVGFGLALVAAIQRNVAVGNQFRQALRARLEGLRLHRMLNALGIDPERYLHTTPVTDIDRQMRRCTDCEDQGTCAQDIEAGHPERAEGYCPNYPELSKPAAGKH